MRPAAVVRPRVLLLAAAFLGLVAVAGLVREDLSGAAQRKAMPEPSRTPEKYGILRLSATGKILPQAIPTVDRATAADKATRINRLGERRERDMKVQCRADTLDLGRWCMLRGPLTGADARSYVDASRACIERGGWLPTAAQLAGVADRVTLADGEMTGTLITTESGSTAAGTSGPTKGSKGDPRTGEPDPIPLQPEPEPESLQYVTMADRGTEAGFVGARPVATAAPFRCAFVKGGQGPTTARRAAPAGGPSVTVGPLERIARADLAAGRLQVTLTAGDVARAEVTLRGRIRTRKAGGGTATGAERTLAAGTATLQPGRAKAVRLRAPAAVRRALGRRGAAVVQAELRVVVRDTAGRTRTVARPVNTR